MFSTFSQICLRLFANRSHPNWEDKLLSLFLLHVIFKYYVRRYLQKKPPNKQFENIHNIVYLRQWGNSLCQDQTFCMLLVSDLQDWILTMKAQKIARSVWYVLITESKYWTTFTKYWLKDAWNYFDKKLDSSKRLYIIFREKFLLVSLFVGLQENENLLFVSWRQADIMN